MKDMEMPPLEEFWADLKPALQPKSKKTRFFAFNNVRAIAAMVLLIVLSFSMFFPGKVSAFSTRIMNAIRIVIKGPLTNILMGFGEGVESGVISETQTQEFALSEVRITDLKQLKDLPDAVLMPVWVPEGYRFSDGIYEQVDKSVHRLRLNFQNREKQELSILEVYSSKRSASGYMYDSDDAQAKEVQVRGTVLI